jgi:hypothetical protein
MAASQPFRSIDAAVAGAKIAGAFVFARLSRALDQFAFAVKFEIGWLEG